MIEHVFLWCQRYEEQRGVTRNRLKEQRATEVILKGLLNMGNEIKEDAATVSKGNWYLSLYFGAGGLG